MNATLLPISIFHRDDSIFDRDFAARESAFRDAAITHVGDDDSSSIFALPPEGEPMGDCNYLPLISALHDNELSNERTLEVERHLTQCADCQAELKQLRALSSSIGQINVPKMPVTSRLRLQKQAGVFAIAGRVRVMRILTAVAAAVFLIAGSMLVYQQLRTRSSPLDPRGVQVEKQDAPSTKSAEPAEWKRPVDRKRH